VKKGQGSILGSGWIQNYTDKYHTNVENFKKIVSRCSSNACQIVFKIISPKRERLGEKNDQRLILIANINCLLYVLH
jgi:hypothetical protein